MNEKNINDYEILEKEDIVLEIKEEAPEYGESSIRWKLFQLQKDKKITKIDADHYIKQNIQVFLTNLVSDYAISLKDKLKREFKNIRFIIYESIILNEWLNHQLRRNTIFIEVERFYSESFFQYLKTKIAVPLLFEPSWHDFTLYSGEITVVVQNLVTQSPIDKQNHRPKIEKLLVDLLSKDLLSLMISDEDRMMMIKEIATTYLINPKTARAYAKRRKNEETLIKVLKTVPLFEKWDFSK